VATDASKLLSLPPDQAARLTELLVESAALGIIALDLDGAITFGNPEACRILGYTADELRGQQMHALVHARRKDGSAYPYGECPIAAALTDGDRHHIDTEDFTRKGGEQFPVTYMSAPMRDGDTIVGAVVLFRDITNRRAAVEALRDSEERYRALVSALDEGIVVRDPDGALWAANESAVRILGRSADELQGLELGDRHWVNLREDGTPYTDGESPGAYTQRTGRPTSRQILGMQIGDRVRWLSMNTRPLFRPGEDAPYSVVISLADITEARLAEKALRESEERFRSLAALAPIGIYLVDAEGQLEWANARALEQFEMTLEQARGSGYRAAIAADDLRALEELWRSRDAGVQSSVTVKMGTAAKPRWAEWRGAAIRNQKGDFTGFVGSLVDVTQDVEAQLSRETEYRILVDNATDLVSRHAEDGTFVFVSPNSAQLLEYPPDELLGTSLFDLVHPDDREAIAARGSSLAERMTGEVRLLRRGGETVWFEITAWPVREQGSGLVVQTVIVGRDVTEKRRAERELRDKEAQLQQAQKMEAMGRLAGGIAHDFNNLLTAIMGYASMLTSGRLMPPAVAGKEIIEAADRARALTSQLLAFSRKQVMAPTPLDINGVIAGLGTMLERLIGESIKITTDLADDLPAVEFDRGQLEQCLLNLAINARDAMPDGGEIRFATRMASVASPRSDVDLGAGRYVELSIADTGVGMSGEVQAQVFEPFFTTKGPGKGTGLGLSTVYGILKQSGGGIAVDSEVGVGTTFTMYLVPSEGCERADETSRLESTAPGGDETILLAEDEPVVRRLAEAQLTELGYRVLVAQDGASALELSDGEDRDIHLLLTDVVMPDMNGRELARRLHDRRPETRVLYMSGYLDTAIDPSSEEIRSQFLAKPFTIATLAATVRSVLDADSDAG
jgi:PAS domain S-box-containing protein